MLSVFCEALFSQKSFEVQIYFDIRNRSQPKLPLTTRMGFIFNTMNQTFLFYIFSIPMIFQ